MGSSQSTCMRQKVLVRQHYACTYQHERHDDDDDHSKSKLHVPVASLFLHDRIEEQHHALHNSRHKVENLEAKESVKRQVLAEDIEDQSCMRPTNFENINLNILG